MASAHKVHTIVARHYSPLLPLISISHYLFCQVALCVYLYFLNAEVEVELTETIDLENVLRYLFSCFILNRRS